ncbi:hypothetical protein M8J76_003750 [Diaphorina citri]|nr:hypothetical protein M8J76_003750 [Diaphorina citri]
MRWKRSNLVKNSMKESTLAGVLPRDGVGLYVRRTGLWIGQEEIRCFTESGSPHSHIGGGDFVKRKEWCDLELILRTPRGTKKKKKEEEEEEEEKEKEKKKDIAKEEKEIVEKEGEEEEQEEKEGELE